MASSSIGSPLSRDCLVGFWIAIAWQDFEWLQALLTHFHPQLDWLPQPRDTQFFHLNALISLFKSNLDCLKLSCQSFMNAIGTFFDSSKKLLNLFFRASKYTVDSIMCLYCSQIVARSNTKCHKASFQHSHGPVQDSNRMLSSQVRQENFTIICIATRISQHRPDKPIMKAKYTLLFKQASQAWKHGKH